MTARANTSGSSDVNGCLFCEIVRDERQANIVFQDEISIAFLDHRPLFPGHCLLITKEHFQTLTDLPREIVGPLFLNAQRLAAAVQKVMQAEGTFVAVNNIVSQSVPHFHLHVVPRRKGDGLKGFFWPRQAYKSGEEMAAVQRALAAELK